jgi:hypothetical protein
MKTIHSNKMRKKSQPGMGSRSIMIADEIEFLAEAVRSGEIDLLSAPDELRRLAREAEEDQKLDFGDSLDRERVDRLRGIR